LPEMIDNFCYTQTINRLLLLMFYFLERRRCLRHEESDNRRQLMSEKYTRHRGIRAGDKLPLTLVWCLNHMYCVDGQGGVLCLNMLNQLLPVCAVARQLLLSDIMQIHRNARSQFSLFYSPLIFSHS